jgi:hypothetical protein
MPEHPPAELPESFKHLTPKQQKFVLHYLANGGNAAQAMRDAGYSPSTAHVTGSQNLAKPMVRRALADLLPLNGITDELILLRLFEGLQATKRHVKYDEKRGHWCYSRKETDHATRLHAADLAMKLKGAYPKEGQQSGSYTLIISQETAVDVQSEPGQPPASSPGTERHERGHLTITLPPPIPS